jgi:hypothetical protein
LGDAKEKVVDLKKGRHRLTLVIESDPASAASVRVELIKPAGSGAQFEPVGGT